MRLSDDEVYPSPPYEGGSYLISLRNPVHWYIKLACRKGKTFGTTHVSTIMPLLVDKTFGKTVEQEIIDTALNLDCMISREAESVQTELEKMILAEVLAQFPQIAAEIPDHYFHFTGMDLYINVPREYEAQRGYFF